MMPTTMLTMMPRPNPAHDHFREPAGDQADNQQNNQALTVEVHRVPPKWRL
jgi:hypothetical protein